MSDIPKNKVQFFPQPYPSASCDGFNCTNRSVYFVGRPDGPLSLCLKLCRSCAEDLVKSLPEELLQVVLGGIELPPAELPEGMVLISQEDMDALMRLAELGAQVGSEGDNEQADIQADANQPPSPPQLQDPQSQYAYPCPECGESFASPQALAGHTRWKHPKDHPQEVAKQNEAG